MIRQAISPRLAMRMIGALKVLVCRLPYQDAHRCRVVGVARVVELRAVRDQADHVDLCPHLDVAARCRNPVLETQAPIRRDWNIHKEIDVRPDVRLPHAFAPGLDAGEKRVTAGVHRFLVMGVAHRIALPGTGSAKSVVAAAGIGRDRQQPRAVDRVKPRPGAQVDIARVADRRGRTVAVGRIMRTEEERIGGLVALKIDNAQGRAGWDRAHPVVACEYRRAVFRRFWIE